jgi:small subunit ribosomal protein S9
MPAPLSQTTGRRKQAVARVRFRPGQGTITVNKLPIEKYFTSATHRMLVTEPLRVTDTAETYDVDATIDGGGISGQAVPCASELRAACASSTPSSAAP